MIQNKPLTWSSKVLAATQIWGQVKAILAQHNIEMPKTPRREDVRLILSNTSGVDILFRNPGNHSDKGEIVPGTGDKTAAMVMVHGDTLTQQFENARKIVERYNIAGNGLSQEFIQALHAGTANDLVKEAYGPAPFEGQAKKLVDTTWNSADGTSEVITATRGEGFAYGVRAATSEIAFRTHLAVYVQGTNTIPEIMEAPGMIIAVNQDWETKEELTRPIVPSIATSFYGEHFKNIPAVQVNQDGIVERIDLQNGRSIAMVCEYKIQENGPALKMA